MAMIDLYWSDDLESSDQGARGLTTPSRLTARKLVMHNLHSVFTIFSDLVHPEAFVIVSQNIPAGEPCKSSTSSQEPAGAPTDRCQTSVPMELCKSK
ncbi:MAG: hypothetical protein ABIO24_13600, partial [Saprospiraceae bacterium]